MKAYFSIAGHVRGALWARTLGYHHGWKKQDSRWSDMHLQDCRQNEKNVRPLLDRQVGEKQDQFP